jgi:nucleotide-binding universal stress UspA family protein
MAGRFDNMQNAFKTILVPVDFTRSTEVAIRKAIELATNDSIIHLFHVQTSRVFGTADTSYYHPLVGNVDSQNGLPQAILNHLKWEIQRRSPYVRICTWMAFDNNIQASIESKAAALGADLVIIAKKSHHSWLPILNSVESNKIAARTGSPVLTVKLGSTNCEPRKIIVPVTDGVSSRKMDVIRILQHKFRVKVFLVTFMTADKPSQFRASAVLQMFQWLKTTVHCPVEYVVLHGSNKVKEIVLYAERINADVLLVHPQTETRIGWPNKHISDVLPPESRVQVLTV